MTDLIFSQIKYDAIKEILEDLYLSEVVQERANKEEIDVNLHENMP